MTEPHPSTNTPARRTPIPPPPPRPPSNPSAPTAAVAAASDDPSAGSGEPVFPFPSLTVRPWNDELVEALGHDPRSLYVERYWTSILGPSATLLLRRLALELDACPDGFELDAVAWAKELGVGVRGGKNGPFWRALDRTARFGTTQRNGPNLVVRRRLPPLNLRQIERLPPHLQQAHRAWSARQIVRPDGRAAGDVDPTPTEDGFDAA